MKFINSILILVTIVGLMACGNGEKTAGNGEKTAGSGEQTTGGGDQATEYGYTTLTAKSTDKIKTFTFQWDMVEGVDYYQLCRKDIAEKDNCDKISAATSDLSVDYTPSSLIDIQSQAFFLMYPSGKNSVLSDELTLDSSDIIAAIGYFKASNTGDIDYFGSAVSLSADGNTLAVGATYEDSSSLGINSQPDDSLSHSGAVYVFQREGNTWMQQAYIKASNPGFEDFFGGSVSLSEDGHTLAVGAIGEDSDTTGINSSHNDISSRSGAAYIFVRSQNKWIQQAYIKANNADITDEFGNSVSLSADGNTLAVGATGEDSITTGVNSIPDDNSLLDDLGAVYVFTRAGSSWTQQSYIKAGNSGRRDYFGGSVSISADGHTLAVGARLEDSRYNDSGAVYVFIRTGNTWVQQRLFRASDAKDNGLFGWSVSLSSDGNTLAVGAGGESSFTGSGAVYVFERTDGLWSQETRINARDTDENDYFGGDIFLSPDGNTLAVGTTGEDSGTSGINSDPESGYRYDGAGATFVFKRLGTTWVQYAYIKASNTQSQDSFGSSVSLSKYGNILVVGAKNEGSASTGINSIPDNSGWLSGAVYMY